MGAFDISFGGNGMAFVELCLIQRTDSSFRARDSPFSRQQAGKQAGMRAGERTGVYLIATEAATGAAGGGIHRDWAGAFSLTLSFSNSVMVI